MSFANTNRNSWPAGAARCRPSSARHSATSAHAVPPPWAHAGNNAITVRASSFSFHSCRNRACPKCQARARDKWLARTSRELLPVPYSHVTFTLPHQLSLLALENPRILYNILFRAVSETLLTIAADPHRLGAQLGFLAVLHTWNQQMGPHVHLHCLVPAGGLSADRSRWIRIRYPRFFLPGKVLGARFRRTFLTLLSRAYRQQKLRFPGSFARLQQPPEFDRFFRQLKNQQWVVHAKRPFGGPEQVLQYLARYTHRVAISNGRLVALQDGQVTFRWRDSAHANQTKLMTLDAVEFIRRFLLHVLPHGLGQDPPLRLSRQSATSPSPEALQDALAGSSSHRTR